MQFLKQQQQQQQATKEQCKEIIAPSERLLWCSIAQRGRTLVCPIFPPQFGRLEVRLKREEKPEESLVVQSVGLPAGVLLVEPQRERHSLEVGPSR